MHSTTWYLTTLVTTIKVQMYKYRMYLGIEIIISFYHLTIRYSFNKLGAFQVKFSKMGKMWRIVEMRRLFIEFF